MLWQITLFGSGGVNPEQLDPNGVLTLALKGFSIAAALIGAIAVIYILVAGFQYITAAGSEAKQVEAKKIITYAIAGLLLVVLSFVVINEVLRRLDFNASIITNDQPATRSVVR